MPAVPEMERYHNHRCLLELICGDINIAGTGIAMHKDLFPHEEYTKTHLYMNNNQQFSWYAPSNRIDNDQQMSTVHFLDPGELNTGSILLSSHVSYLIQHEQKPKSRQLARTFFNSFYQILVDSNFVQEITTGKSVMVMLQLLVLRYLVIDTQRGSLLLKLPRMGQNLLLPRLLWNRSLT